MVRKYEFTGEVMVKFGIEYKQIKAVISFGSVIAGSVGGWIEKEENLDQSGNAWVSGNARVSGNAEVSGDARVSGNAWVYGNAEVYGDAWVYGDAEVYGDAWVYGDAEVYGNAEVSGNAEVLWLSRIGSRLGTTTVFKTKVGIGVSCGCFYGDLAEFEKAVEETHGDTKHGREYKAFIMLVKAHFELEDQQ